MAHFEELNLFEPTTADTSLHSREWIEYRPVSQITDVAALDFNIPAQSSAFISETKCTEHQIETGQCGQYALG